MHRMTPRPSRKRRLRLGPHVGVAFAMRLAPLAVADDGQRGAGVLEHRRADVAGMRALVGGMDILATDRKARRGAHGALDERRRHAQGDVAAGALRAPARWR